MILDAIIGALVRMEKNSSVTQQELSIMQRSAITLVVNTGIINLVVNGNFAAFGFTLFAGSYDDFSPDWYQSIGTAICITMIVNVVHDFDCFFFFLSFFFVFLPFLFFGLFCILSFSPLLLLFYFDLAGICHFCGSIYSFQCTISLIYFNAR